jgi:hypothetical protein
MKTPRRAFLGALAASPLGATATATAATAAPSTEGSMAEGLLAAARARFGHHLTSAEVEQLGRGIVEAQREAERLRAHPPGQAEEPVGLFEARPPALGGARGR